MTSVQQSLNQRLAEQQEVWTEMRDNFELIAENIQDDYPFHTFIVSLKNFYSACLGDDHQQVINMAINVKNNAVDLLEVYQELSNDEESTFNEGDFLNMANNTQKSCDNVTDAEDFHKRLFNTFEANQREWLESLSPEDRAFHENFQLENRQLL